jgi:hypothetical protein
MDRISVRAVMDAFGAVPVNRPRRRLDRLIDHRGGALLL